MFKVGNKGFEENPLISLIPFQIGYLNRFFIKRTLMKPLTAIISFESRNTIFYCYDILEGE